MFTTTTDYQVSVFCLFTVPHDREFRGVYASLEGAKAGATNMHPVHAHEHVWEQQDSKSWDCSVKRGGVLCEYMIEQWTVLA